MGMMVFVKPMCMGQILCFLEFCVKLVLCLREHDKKWRVFRQKSTMNSWTDVPLGFMGNEMGCLWIFDFKVLEG